MASNNYLPPRPVDPSTYLNPAVNQGATIPAPPPTPQGYQTQAPLQQQMYQTAYQPNPYQGNYPLAPQAQVQQWQTQQPQQQMPPQQGNFQPTPEQIQAYQAQRESQQKEANVINNATLGTLGFATIGTGIALAETVLPQESDLSKPHVSKVGNVTYQVDLEEKPQGFVEKTKGLFGQGTDKERQVRRITHGDTTMHINAYDPNTGKANLVAVDVSDDIQAHYEVDNAGKYRLKEVVSSRGRGREGLHLSLDDLDELKKFKPAELERATKQLKKTKPPKNEPWKFLFSTDYRQAWADHKEEVKTLKDKIAKLSVQEANHEALNLSKEDIKNLVNATKTIELPDLNAVVKNAHMPHHIDWAEMFQKVLTKGGLGAILGGLLLGGGTWAFQTLREKSPEQKRIDAQIAQNQANQPQPGRPPQQQGGQGMNPAMLANNGMF
jgi:hypothetical protein